jgi:hypothetical protein
MRTGLVLGGFVAFRVTPRFQLQPEVVYHQKGIEISGASGGPLRDGEAEIELTYVEVPLLAVFRFDPDGGRGGYVFGGPAFGFNTRAEIVGGAGAVPGDADLEDQVKDSEVSLVLGAGFLAGPFLVEARWTEGLSAVNEDDLFADLRNRSIAVLAGVRF